MKKLSLMDILGLGFMTFAFFLGAGNIIFPPKSGFLSGNHMMFSVFGFLISGVGLPLLGILSVAYSKGGFSSMVTPLPRKISLLFGVAINVILGPLLVCPRAGLVSYEMGVAPFLNHSYSFIFSLFFFGICVVLALKKGTLLDAIGKVLTPILIILLVILSISVLLNPQGSIPAASGSYIHHPFNSGFLLGYNTMDIFASLMFGTLIIDVLKEKGVKDQKALCKYLSYAGGISAIGLAFVYVSLFYLGSTSGGISQLNENGGQIISAYVIQLFGLPGSIILAAIITLACLTTVVGLLAASSEYFSENVKLGSYRFWVILSGFLCVLISNVGLNELIKLSSPILAFCYPLAITLVLLTFIRNKLNYPDKTYRSVLVTTAIFSFLDAIQDIVKLHFFPSHWLSLSWYSQVPLSNDGLAWVLPTLLILLINMSFFNKLKR